MLQWRPILEEYGKYIEYIPGDLKIAADALSQVPNNRNQGTTHEPTYLTETMSKMYYIKLPEGT